MIRLCFGMLYDQRSALAGYVSGLLAQGRTAFDAREAQTAIGAGHGAFLDSAERLQRRGALVRPRHGFYVAPPPQFQSWGAPPPDWYIDALMRHEDAPYYVGLLKAAERHGAAHQAVMEFQVVTPKRLPVIRAGRSRIVFYHRKDMAAAEGGVETHQTPGGAIKVSGPELTALDLFRCPRGAGGIDNIATVLSEMAEKIDPKRLAKLAKHAKRPALQRLGWLLDRLGCGDLTGPMLKSLRPAGAPPPLWTEFDPREAGDPDFTPEPQEHNDRWRVIVRRLPEPDV